MNIRKMFLNEMVQRALNRSPWGVPHLRQPVESDVWQFPCAVGVLNSVRIGNNGGDEKLLRCLERSERPGGDVCINDHLVSVLHQCDSLLTFGASQKGLKQYDC